MQNESQIAPHGDDTVPLLALSILKGVGFKTLRGMAESGLSFSDALGISAHSDAVSLFKKFGAKIDPNNTNDWHDVRRRILERGHELKADLDQLQVSLIFRSDPRYPGALLDLPDPPHWLFVQGEVDVLSKPSLSVVGTRNPSEDGLWLARFVGLCLPYWDRPTVSGLALGIDQAIHRTSIVAGSPTIAVLGTGIKSDYPKNAVHLREEIVSNGGAIITEYLPQESYSAENFVRRNRIQAALGRVLIPVEWSAKSGTAHTVRFAVRLNRPIAALRLPIWVHDRVPISDDTGGGGSKIFTIPGEEAAFRSFIEMALTNVPRPTTTQPSLFDGT